MRLRSVIFNHRSLVFQYIGGAASLIFRALERQHKQGGDGYGGGGSGKWRLAKQRQKRDAAEVRSSSKTIFATAALIKSSSEDIKVLSQTDISGLEEEPLLTFPGRSSAKSL